MKKITMRLCNYLLLGGGYDLRYMKRGSIVYRLCDFQKAIDRKASNS